jgi:hypothetical protein
MDSHQAEVQIDRLYNSHEGFLAALELARRARGQPLRRDYSHLVASREPDGRAQSEIPDAV